MSVREPVEVLARREPQQREQRGVDRAEVGVLVDRAVVADLRAHARKKKRVGGDRFGSRSGAGLLARVEVARQSGAPALRSRARRFLERARATLLARARPTLAKSCTPTAA